MALGNADLRDSLKRLKKSYSKKYTTKQWDEREAIYVECLDEMDVPQSPLPVDIQEIIHVSDVMFTQAKIDFAHLKRQLEIYENRLYIKKKTYIIHFRQIGDAKSDEMAKSLAVQAIDEEDLAKAGASKSYNLYDIINTVKLRLTFIETIVGIIMAKQRVLITESGVMKLEANFDGDPK